VDTGIFSRARLPLLTDSALSSEMPEIGPKVEDLRRRKSAIDFKLGAQWPSAKSHRRGKMPPPHSSFWNPLTDAVLHPFLSIEIDEKSELQSTNRAYDFVMFVVSVFSFTDQ
jgi:hypothetical protein